MWFGEMLDCPREPIDLSRIANAIDIATVRLSTVTLVGTGGGAGLCKNLARCGVGRFNLIDHDVVEAVNVCRQEHTHDRIGMTKVMAVACELRPINPAVSATCYPRDFCTFTDEEIDR